VCAARLPSPLEGEGLGVRGKTKWPCPSYLPCALIIGRGYNKDRGRAAYDHGVITNPIANAVKRSRR